MRVFVMLTILLVGAVSCQEKQHLSTQSTSKITQIDSLLMAWHQQNRFDGTVLIAHENEVMYTKAIGWANRVHDIPMKLQHKFDIASLSKAFIGVLIMQLVEEKKLSLTHTVKTYIEDFPSEYADQMTIHQLLTHTSGLGDYDHLSDSLKANNWRRFKRMYFEQDEFLQFIGKVRRAGVPKKQFYYTSFSYVILKAIIEKIEKKPFPQILQERICEPLGMKNTVYATHNEQIIKDLVAPYNQVKRGNETRDTIPQYERNQYIDLSLRVPIYSTVDDLLLWAQSFNTQALLSQQSLEQISKNHIQYLGENFTYGYGWAVHDQKGAYFMGNLDIDLPYIIHGGAMEGYKSMLTIIDKGKYIIIHLSNIGNQTNELQLTQDITHILLSK